MFGLSQVFEIIYPLTEGQKVSVPPLQVMISNTCGFIVIILNTLLILCFIIFTNLGVELFPFSAIQPIRYYNKVFKPVRKIKLGMFNIQLQIKYKSII